MPDGYNEDDPKLGRPQNSITKRNTQVSNFGKDRLGVSSMKDKDKNNSDSIRNNFKGGSPLALETSKTTYLKNKKLFEGLDKKLSVFSKENKKSSLLDENQLNSVKE